MSLPFSLFAPRPLSGLPFRLDLNENSTILKVTGKTLPEMTFSTDMMKSRLYKNECESCEWTRLDQDLILDFKNTFLTSAINFYVHSVLVHFKISLDSTYSENFKTLIKNKFLLPKLISIQKFIWLWLRVTSTDNTKTFAKKKQGM